MQTAASAGASSQAIKPAEQSGGGVYHNGALGFSYTYPKGWTVATPEMLRSANAGNQSTPSSAQGGRSSTPSSGKISELIFYAYVKDDGTFRAVPSVRITALESFGAMLTPELMKSDTSAREKSGLKAIRGPEKFSIGDQDLYRVDFADAKKSETVVSMIQTVVYDHVLAIEFTAANKTQLEELVTTVNSCVFADADKK